MGAFLCVEGQQEHRQSFILCLYFMYFVDAFIKSRTELNEASDLGSTIALSTGSKEVSGLSHNGGEVYAFYN